MDPARHLVVAAAALVLAGGMARAAAFPPEPEAIAIVIGANIGQGDDEPLRYAESDARRLRDVLVQLGGVRAERALLVIGGAPEDVYAAITEARGRAAELAAAGRPVTVYLYYSGHGDDEALHVARGRLPIAQLRRRLAEVPARLRLTFLDACRTGGRSRGVTRGAAFALDLAPNLPEGTVEVRASAPGEAAQESEELGGAVFSHFLVSGLRGAADGDRDGRVTLDELYAYVYRRTLQRTGSGGPVVQHPELRVRLAGSGEVVLTHPSAQRAWIEVPPGADRYLVFSQPAGTVVGELGGEAARLALPAGRFLVVRRQGERAAAAEVDLAWGGGRRIAPSEFRPLSREELVARGGVVELRPFRLEARVAFEALPAAADSLGLYAGAGAARSLGRWEIGADVGYAGGPVETPALTGWRHGVVAGAGVGLRAFSGRLTFVAALGAEVRYTRELLVRMDADRVVAAGYPPRINLDGVGAGPRLQLRLSAPLGREMSLALVASATALVRREAEAGTTEATVVRPVLGIGLALGRAF